MLAPQPLFRPRALLVTFSALALDTGASLLSDTAPTLADAQARVAELAADGASYISTGWNTAPANAVLGEVLPRG
jgi:hypothetical protein